MLKRALVVAMIGAVTLMGLAACSGGEGGTTNEATPSAEVTVSPETGATSMETATP